MVSYYIYGRHIRSRHTIKSELVKVTPTFNSLRPGASYINCFIIGSGNDHLFWTNAHVSSAGLHEDTSVKFEIQRCSFKKMSPTKCQLFCSGLNVEHMSRKTVPCSFFLCEARFHTQGLCVMVWTHEIYNNRENMPSCNPHSILFPWNTTIDIKMSQSSHDVMITTLWRQNDVATSFRRHNDVIIASCVCWEKATSR